MKFLKSNKGFTLIEIIAVLIILGTIFVVIVPRFIDFDSNANDQINHLQVNATERYETVRLTGMETGLDAEGNDVNESEGLLTKEK
jgi:prepilin-type N-terminal cleavage/methylation domain-containing protein